MKIAHLRRLWHLDHRRLVHHRKAHPKQELQGVDGTLRTIKLLTIHPKLCASAQSFFIFPQQQKKRNNYPTPALPFAYNPPTIYIDGI